MAQAAVPVQALVGHGKVTRAFTILAWTLLVLLAVGFIWKYVFHYYFNYDAQGFGPYWTRRGALLLHITGGMTALLTAPWQFFSGLRGKSLGIHRRTGIVFLLGVTAGTAGALYLAFTTTFGWAFGFGLVTTAAAWLSTSGMAYYAIRQRQFEIHKEWMIRAYIVTFGFVTFRVFNDYGPTSRLKPANDLAITLAWACWVVPLFAAEIILQLRRMCTSLPKRTDGSVGDKWVGQGTLR
jgi:hypothetical protein